MTVVGEVFVAVRPDDSGFANEVEADLRRSTRTIGDNIGSALGGALAEQTGDKFTRELPGQINDGRSRYIAAGRDIGNDIGRGIAQTADDEIQRGIGGSLNKVAIGAGAALAAGFAVKGVLSAISDAADIGESINAINVVLGEGAASFLAFGETAANSLGLTQAALNQAVIPIAAGLKNAGSGGEVLSAQLQDIATRATDVASVFNVDVNEVLEAFGSAIRGEAEPARRFGINLNEASISAEAMRLGLAGAGEEVSQAAKTQAAYSLVLQQTSVAQGDFANTANSLPNLLRRIQATGVDAKIALGEGLLPSVTALSQSFLPLLQNIGPLADTIGRALVPIVDGLAEALTGVIPAVQSVLVALLPAIGPIAGALGSILGVIGNIITALAPVIEPIATLIGVLAGALGGVLVKAGEALVPVITEIVVAILPPLLEIVRQLTPIFVRLADVVGGALANVFTTLGPLIAGILPVFVQVFGVFEQLAATTLEAVLTAIAEVINALLEAVRPMLPILIQVAQTVGGALTQVFTALSPVIGQLAKAFGTVLVKVIQSIAPVLPQLAQAFSDIALAVADLVIALIPILPPLTEIAVLLLNEITVPQLVAMATAFSMIASAGAQIAAIMVQILASGIGEVIDFLVEFVTGVADLNPQDFVNFFDFVLDGLAGLGDEVMTFFGDLAGNLATAALGGVQSMVDLGAQLIGAVVQGVTDGATGLFDIFVNLPGRLLEFAFTLFLAGAQLGKSIIDGLVGLLGQAGEGLGSVLKGVVNGVIGAINSIIEKINEFQVHIHLDIPFAPDVDFDFDGLGIPTIPKLARGGVFSGLGLVGERGPELLDIGNLTGSVFPTDRFAAALAGVGGGGQSLTINGGISVPVQRDPDRAGVAVVDELQSASFRRGR